MWETLLLIRNYQKWLQLAKIVISDFRWPILYRKDVKKSVTNFKVQYGLKY